MRMLLSMAWRNLWRNPRRTGILVCAIMVGLIGVLVSMGFTAAWLDEMKANAVRLYAGHIKIHAAGYFDDPVIEHAFTPGPVMASRLQADERVRAWGDRVVVQGMLSIAAQSRIVQMVGIDPAAERTVSTIPDAVAEGAYLDGWNRPGQPILIGRRLSERLGKGIGSKVVLMSQQFGGTDLGSAAFRIAGIFESGNGGFDEAHVYVRLEDLQRMLNLGDRVTETVVMLHREEDSDAAAAALGAKWEGEPIEVLSWRERLPLVARTIEFSRSMMIPYYAIFYAAMAFGVVNTLLMAVGERTHEIGILMAMGMRRRGVVGLIVLESAVLGVLAGLLGSAAGWAIVAVWGIYGIDMGGAAEAVEYLHVSRVLYPRLSGTEVAAAAAATLAVAASFSLYPALRAARLSPVDAIRSSG